LKNGIQVVLILDSSIFINNINILQLDYPLFTVNDISDELLSENAKLIFDIAVMNNKLILKEPRPESLQYIEKISEKTGDLIKLSKIDKQIIALAWEIKNDDQFTPIVLTEDYSIQNVLTEMNIEFNSVIEVGIKDQIYWIYYCQQCNQIIEKPSKDFKCPNCGSNIKRKPNKIAKIKK